jgi:hypothetical protein
LAHQFYSGEDHFTAWIVDKGRSDAKQRHVPPPWSVEDQGSCFVVCDHNGQPLAYVYYAHPQAGDLTWDEARLH